VTPRKFPSKVDAWLVLVLVAVLVLQLGVFIYVAANRTAAGPVFVALGATVAVYLLIGVTLARTYYEVDGRRLRVVSGFFRWTIPLADIRSVQATHSPLASPALSLDRLRIRYGKRGSILVSPADKQHFLKALGAAGTGDTSGG
jgi:uncharacterized membrane protein YdbT with pleckstrin-like domain